MFLDYYKRIDKVAKQEGKVTLLMFINMLFWYFIYGATLTDYLNYKFYNRKLKEKIKYAVVRTQNKFYEKVSPSKYKTFFTIKPNFLNNFKKYVKRDWYIPEYGIEKLKEFLNNNEEFMIKPIDGLGGQDVEKINSKNIKNIKKFYEKLLNNNMFLEELIIQHKKLSMLCNSSVNTLRIMTFVENSKSEILFCGLRVGNGYNSVDNFHKGGMGILVDINTGKLKGNAIDKDLNVYKKHPVTKTLFNNYQLPFWKETKELVLKSSLTNQNIKVVGWDVAITKDGPVLVEGNRRPGFDLVQVLYDRGRKDIIKKVLKEINNKK